ncbi:hypothetical protein MAR621_03126 [Maribacter dokdonensis]|nr:hypothetical protein MAR621_03126 [Maribacter dokdonensis]
MKSIYSILLVLGLIFTSNAQADEIINAADMFPIPIVELQDFETNDYGIEQNDNQGHDLYNNESYRYDVASPQGRYSVITDPYIKSIENTDRTDLWGGNIDTDPKWRGTTGELRVFRAEGSGESLQRDDNELTRSNYDTTANHKQRGGKAYQLAYTDKVGGHRCAFMESDGHSFKIH